MKSEKNGKPQAFTGEELETMHNHSGDDRLLFLLLRLTELRLGEVVGLTWGEVSFDREQIACVQRRSLE
jgi:integrase